MLSDFDARRDAQVESGDRSAQGGESLPITSNQDVTAARHAVRAAAVEAGFSLVEQTKIVTAASELARNCYVHGGGGTLRIDRLTNGVRRGVRLVVSDCGPGIGDVESALEDGFSTARGLGYGLGGTKRLMDEFQLETEPGRGTTVTVTRWTTA
jgi:serine/threonine-protein kinase RsbT